MMKTKTMSTLLGGALLACSMSLPAFAAEVSGIHFDDTVTVGGKELQLNGLGLRKKFVVKVYAAGLYLPEKARTPADVLKQTGPRRVTLIFMRDVSSEDFGDAYMQGLNDNVEEFERSKIAPQIVRAGQLFASLPGLKKHDVLSLDWIPGTGAVYTLNGKKLETFPDVAYYNAMLRIWLGNNPVDPSLKPRLLGGKD